MMDIDIVYLWVDGSDPKWQEKHDAFCGNTYNAEIDGKSRYANNDELKYSLRSIEMYAPWIRNIFIVTDNQIPKWLNTRSPKIKIVDHTDIMPAESRPCFNSSLIEHFIYRIPGLAEHFLYGNDDMYINRKVTPNDFFTNNGLPIIRFRRMPFRSLRWAFREKVRNKHLSNYRKMLAHSSQLVKDKYGKYYTGIPHHNIDAYLRSDYQRMVEEVFQKEFSANNKNKIRNDNDIHRSVIAYAVLAEKRGELHYVTEKESMIVKIHKESNYKKLEKYRPMFFCMNDSEYANEQSRTIVKTYLERLFPFKSSFEK